MNPSREEALFALALAQPAGERAAVKIRQTSVNPKQALMRWTNARCRPVPTPPRHRLISTSTGREAVKLWEVGTRQELLTLSGTGSRLDAARWSADGDVILAGAPWQAWSAPSLEEIAAAEAKEKREIKHWKKN